MTEARGERRGGSGHPLARLRNQLEWSQQMLADQICDAAGARHQRVGVNRFRVSDWESGRTEPAQKSQKLMAELFDVPWEIARAAGWPHWLPVQPIVPPATLHGALTALWRAVGAYTAGESIGAYSTVELADLAQRLTDANRLLGDRVQPTAGSPAARSRPDDPPEWLMASVRAVLTTPAECQEISLVDACLAAVTRRLSPTDRSDPTSDPAHRNDRLSFAAAAHLARVAAASTYPYLGHAISQRYACAAVHAAFQAGDWHLTQCALGDLALLAILDGDTTSAFRLLRHVAPPDQPAEPSAGDMTTDLSVQQPVRRPDGHTEGQVDAAAIFIGDLDPDGGHPAGAAAGLFG